MNDITMDSNIFCFSYGSISAAVFALYMQQDYQALLLVRNASTGVLPHTSVHAAHIER